MKVRYIIISLTILCICIKAQSQQLYSLDASHLQAKQIAYPYHLGNAGPAAKAIRVNNDYITIGGKVVLPVMGEFHFSRYPRKEWKDVLLKMKACGINIVACYVFWIHHEEIEGQFDWSGNKDFRAFIKLCQQLDLYVYPRIGPWDHGEVRNGGFPDWLVKKKYMTPRTNDPVYQSYVKQWYHQIGLQMKGLLYKDGGPIIGIQLENEYHHGKAGEAHILWLKKTAIAEGMDVPLYTVTGWGNASVPKDEVIPLWGSYPGAPWNANLKKITDNAGFVFDNIRNDTTIGNDKHQHGYQVDVNHYPFFTCELGLGNEITEHRRPVFSRFDGLAIATAKLGSGSNLLGYYVFAGGSNPVGQLTTMEENRDETGYWNQYPDISYDFQTAIKETGELAPSYYQIKKLHYFVNEFGHELAPMQPVIGPQNDPHKDLQYALRARGNSGFLFGINYYRGFAKPVQKNVQFQIKLPGENLRFPSKAINIPDSCIFIWPFNMHLQGALLKYASAQPLCHLQKQGIENWFFYANKRRASRVLF